VKRLLVSLIGTLLMVLGPATSSAATPQTVALWHMDEPPGASSMGDSSGLGNNGALTGVVTGQPGDPSVPPAQGYKFDGPGWATVPSSPSLNPGIADLSFTVHASFTQIPPSDYDIVRKGLAATPGGDYKMEFIRKTVNGVVTTRLLCHFTGIVNGSKVRASILTGRGLEDGGWHTTTCSKGAGTISATVDGVTTSKVVTVGSIGNSSAVTVGANSRQDDQYQGFLDEISIAIG
jgi:hypothetical protein